MRDLRKVGVAVAGLAVGALVLLNPPASMAAESDPLRVNPLGIGPTAQVQAESGPDLSLRSSPRKATTYPGRIVNFRAKVRNVGGLDSGRVRIRVLFPKRRLTRTRPVNRRIPSVPAGKDRKGRFSFKVASRVFSDPRFGIRFQLFEGGEPTTIVRSKVTVLPIRILPPISIKVPVTG